MEWTNFASQLVVRVVEIYWFGGVISNLLIGTMGASSKQGHPWTVYSHFQCLQCIAVSLPPVNRIQSFSEPSYCIASHYLLAKLVLAELNRIQPFCTIRPLSACRPHIARYESALGFLMAAAPLFSLSDSQIETPRQTRYWTTIKGGTTFATWFQT